MAKAPRKLGLLDVVRIALDYPAVVAGDLGDSPVERGGRHALIEIMGANLRTKETIVHGESEGKSFYEIIEANHTFGWRTFDAACLEAYEQNLITEETALLYASKRGTVSRNIDKVKKARGEIVTLGDLKMKEPIRATRPNLPTSIKLK